MGAAASVVDDSSPVFVDVKGGSNGERRAQTGFVGIFETGSDDYEPFHVPITIPIGATKVTAVELSTTWRDQGWGNQKGRIRLVIMRGNDIVAETAVDHVAPHQDEDVQLALSAEQLTKAQPRDLVMAQIAVGGGGGHQMHLSNGSVSCNVEVDVSVIAARTRLEGVFRNASDSYESFHEPIEVPQGATVDAVDLETTWRDQGFGNQKGRIRVVIMRGAEEIVAENAVDHVALHENEDLKLSLSAEQLATAKPGDRILAQIVVGGGGGHELHLNDGNLCCTFRVEGKKAGGEISSEDVDLKSLATTYIVEGKIPDNYDNIPKQLLREEALQSFGLEIVELLTTSSSRIDASRG